MSPLPDPTSSGHSLGLNYPLGLGHVCLTSLLWPWPSQAWQPWLLPGKQKEELGTHI